MLYLRTCLLTLLFLFISGTIALSQEIDKNLIIGKWRFVKTTSGPAELDYQYNGNPLLTFEKNGNWITEDTNPNYRQSGTWKIENNLLIRNPIITKFKNTKSYERVIGKLTLTELVFYAVDSTGYRVTNFHFTRIE